MPKKGRTNICNRKRKSSKGGHQRDRKTKKERQNEWARQSRASRKPSRKSAEVIPSFLDRDEDTPINKEHRIQLESIEEILTPTRSALKQKIQKQSKQIECIQAQTRKLEFQVLRLNKKNKALERRNNKLESIKECFERESLRYEDELERSQNDVKNLKKYAKELELAVKNSFDIIDCKTDKRQVEQWAMVLLIALR